MERMPDRVCSVRWRAIALLLLALACWSASAHAGVWTSFTQSDGLPGGRVAAVGGTPYGTLVVAADNLSAADSVAEYDGIRFHNLANRYASPPDFGTNVTALAVSRDSTVWVGTRDRGVFELRAGGWTQHTRDDGLGGRLSNNVRRLLARDDGSLIAIVQDGGVSRWDGAQWTTLGVEDGLPNLVLLDGALAPDGTVWVAHIAGLSHTTSGVVQNVTYPQGFERLMVAADGHVWAIRSSHGAVEFDEAGNFLVRFFQGSAPPSLPTNDLVDVVAGTHGDVWFGTFSLGLSRKTVSGWEQLTTSDGLLGNTVSTLYRDAAGVLWAGTQAGLSRYEGALWMTWNQGAGLGALEVNGLARGPSSDLDPKPPYGIREAPVYAALGTLPPGAPGGAARLSGHTTESIQESGAPLIGRFRAVSAVSGGAWAIDDASLLRITGTAVTERLDPPPGGLDPLRSLLAARDGTVWVGSDSALYRYDGSAFTRVDLPALGLMPDIRSLAQDESGRIWLTAFRTAAARLDPVSGSLTLFGPAQGVPGTQFNAVHVAADGTVWIGSDQGAARLVGDQVQFVARSANGLPADVVSSFASSAADERVWIGTNSGVAYFEDGSVTAYGAADGLPSPGIRSLAVVGDVVVIGTVNGGIALHHPDRTAPRGEIEFAPPPVSGGRRAQFLFRGGDLESGESFIRYAWAVDGAGLTPFTNARAVALDNLTDGHHTFSLFVRDRALNVSGNLNFEFEIDATPPQPVLAQPAFGAVVRATTPLRGRIDDPRFAFYRVEVRPAGEDDPALNPWILLDTGTQVPASGDTIFVWDTSPLIDGDYELRVSVRDTLGLVGYAAAGVTIDNLSPGDAVTAPARINAQSGGRIFTLNSEVEAYFPPNAFDSDRIVEIDSIAVAERPTPAGVNRWLAGWHFSPDEVALAKPVTLTFSLAALGPDATAPTIFRFNEDASYTTVGGTVDRARGTLTTSVSALGDYFVSDTAPIGFAAEGGRDLDVQPRAFSPKGGTFDDRAAVAFTLAQAGSARVRVYDRQGRLVRSVFDGTLAAGRNVVYWDGRDGDGETMPSGVYFVALESEGETETRSVAVVNR